MKICFFVADITFKGGIERVLSNLTEGLLAIQPDLDLTIVSQYRTFDTPNYPFNPKVKIDYLTEQKYADAPGSLKRIVRHMRNIKNIRRYFKNKDFDVISIQSFPNVFLFKAAGLDSSKVIAVEHVYWQYYSKPLLFIRKQVYKHIPLISVLTDRDYLYFNQWHPDVVRIPNPIDVSNPFKSELKSKDVIAVGRLEDEKNFSALIDAFTNVAQKNTDWRLHIYGEGTLKEALQSQIVTHSMEPNIILEGTSDNIDEEMRKCSFLVMSSKLEGFGMVLVEAMRNGLPCVSFDCPAGPSNIITDGVDGLLVENQNKEKLAAAIQLMISNPDKRIEMGANALEKVKAFDSKYIASQWLDVFNQFTLGN